MTYSFGNRSTGNMVGLHPNLHRVLMRAIQITTQDFGIAAKAVRTAAEQGVLYAQGRTKPGNIVTSKDGYKNKSNHQPHGDGFGYAVDLTPFVAGRWDVNNEAAQYPIAAAMSQAAKELGIKIVWGGNWYQAMNDYGSELSDMKAAVERYQIQHPGRDFIDLPHFELQS